MVYKKYIKRGGKIYGPYHYHSYRDAEGNVKTRYVPFEETKVKRVVHFNWFIFFAAAGILFFAALMAFYFSNSSLPFSEKSSEISSAITGFASRLYSFVTGFASDNANEKSNADGNGNGGGNSEKSSSSTSSESDSETGEITQVSDTTSTAESTEQTSETPQETEQETEQDGLKKQEEKEQGKEEKQEEKEEEKGEEKEQKDEEKEGGETEEPGSETGGETDTETGVENGGETGGGTGTSGGGSTSTSTSGGGEGSGGSGGIEEEKDGEKDKEKEKEKQKEEIPEENLNITITETNITLMNETLNETGEANISLITETKQYGAVLGKPVKWNKKIKVDILAEDSTNEPPASLESLTIELPKSAGNVSVSMIDGSTGQETSLTESGQEVLVIPEIVPEEVASNLDVTARVTGNAIFRFFNSIASFLASITGRAVDITEGSEEVTVEVIEQIKDNDAIVVEYYTEAPYAEEIELDAGKSKQVRVIGPDEVHYENVLAFSELPAEVQDTNSIALYWIVNETRQAVIFNAVDSDNNSLYDYIEWVVPGLSEQVYEIILITKAVHLDENRTFVSNIYESVKSLDGIWSEEIPAGHYVRVEFERNLTFEKDITVYARSNEVSSVEIYAENGEEVIASINDISGEGTYKTLLNGLGEESRSTFDLKVLNSGVEFDWIVDPANTVPTIGSVTLTSTNVNLNNTRQNLTGSASATDAEGDNITYWYSWYRNDTLNATTLITTKDSIGGGLVAYYPLNHDTMDYWGNFNSSNSTAVINTTQYKIDGAHTFSSAKTAFNSFSALEYENVTISAWIYAESFNGGIGYNPIVTQYDDGANGYYLYLTDAYKPAFYIGGQEAVDSTAADLNKWYHLVGTYNGTTINVYVNGQLTGTTVATGLVTAAYTAFIGYDLVDDLSFDGVIDEVMIFNRTLSSPEIKMLYDGSMIGGKNLNASKLEVGYTWKLGAAAADYELWSDEVNSSGILILGNIAPVVNSVSLTSTNVSANSTTYNLTGSASATDAEGDNITYWYSWYRNDTLNATTLITTKDANGNGLVAYYPLNNDTMDYWGNKNGTNGGANLNESQGKVGGAFSFNGTTYINISNPPILSANEFALSVWVKYANAPPDGFTNWIVNQDDGNFKRIFQLSTNDKRFTWHRFSAPLDVSSDEDIQANRWYHVVVIFDGTNHTMYVDGRKVASKAGTFSSSNSLAVFIGSDNQKSVFFNGSIDEVMLFNRTLSGSEIKMLYDGGMAGGNILDSSKLEKGYTWKLGVSAVDYELFSDEVNSSGVFILSSGLCGNGVLDAGESCDLSVFGLRCVDVGFATGSLSCNLDCTLDTSGCSYGGGGPSPTPTPTPIPCTVTSWSPAESTVCLGVSFTQTSNCATTRTSTGTATAICPLANDIACGTAITSTNGCGTCIGNGIKCDIGKTCTNNVCVAAAECDDNSDCNDKNSCTVDSCSNGYCSNTAIVCGKDENCINGNCVGAPYKIPEEIIIAKSNCDSSWQCEQWSECSGKYNIQDILTGVEVAGEKHRHCYDLNGCAYGFTESQKCVFKVPVVVGIESWCNEEYIEVRNTTGEVLARLKRGEVAEKYLAVDLNLVGKGYCAYCYDNVKNYDEEDVDCGGSCISCYEANQIFSEEALIISPWVYWILLTMFFVMLFSAVYYTAKNLIIAIRTGEIDLLLRRYHMWKNKGYDVSVLEHHIAGSESLKNGQT